jgi:hypothetical protein
LCSQNEESITWRFSPGYGDLPLDTHINLLGALDTSRKIGLTVSRSLILIPSKSVTAIIGVTKKVIKIPPQDIVIRAAKILTVCIRKQAFHVRTRAMRNPLDGAMGTELQSMGLMMREYRKGQSNKSGGSH